MYRSDWEGITRVGYNGSADCGPIGSLLGTVLTGVFAAALAWDQPEWTITEAPIDALSLTYIGVPAMALCGTALRTWLVEAAAEQSRGLILAFDRDKQGAEASETWAAECRRFGVGFTIIQPGKPAKDWNEQLVNQG